MSSLQVHHLLHAPPNHEDGECPVVEDIDSLHSGEDSNTDSGKGPSEDGEKYHRIKHVTPTPRQSAALQKPIAGRW